MAHPSAAPKSSTFSLCPLLATSKWPPVIGNISKKASTSWAARTTKLLMLVFAGSHWSSAGMHDIKDDGLGDQRGEGVGAVYAVAIAQNGHASWG